MKKFSFGVLAFFLTIMTSTSLIGDTIWSENFPYPDGTTEGSGSPPKWTIDISNCTITPPYDWFEVKSNQMEARDIDGEAVWETESIDISGYTDVNLSVDISEDGTMESADYVKVYYILDGGAETIFETNGNNTDDFTSVTATQSGLSGSSVVIIIKVKNNASSEYHRFDNVTVQGTLAGGVAAPSNFTATVVSTSQIDLAWNKNSDGNDVLIACNTTNTFGTPVDGVSYSAGTSIPGGGISLGSNSGEFFNHTSLSPDTEYFYKIWSIGTQIYSKGVETSARTWIELPPLCINEFLAINRECHPDEYGDYDDWVEIYNKGNESVDIGGFYITDNLSNPFRWQIPATNPSLTTIPPKGHLLIWCDYQNWQGVLHVNISLNGNGEDIGLFAPEGIRLIDGLSFNRQKADKSYGRYPDGCDNWQNFCNPTPGSTNIIKSIKISDITQTPKSPTASDEVIITAKIVSDFGVHSAVVEYKAVGNSYEVPLKDNGMCYDGMAGDNIYGAIIPPMPAGALVEYFVRVTHEKGITFKPSGSSLSYTVQGIAAVPTIVINEFLAVNHTICLDDFGEYEDWIELYNSGTAPVDIGGLFITDNLGNPTRCQIPATSPEETTIPPNGFIVLWCDFDSEQGVLHLEMSLNMPTAF